MKKRSLVSLILLSAVTSNAQRLEPFVIEKHQIYAKELATQHVEKIRHTCHVFADGKREDSKSYLESMEINVETGEVLTRIYAPYQGKTQVTYYHYENDQCYAPTSEDVYQVSEDENEEDLFLVSRVYTLDDNCNATSFRDEDDDIYQIRKRELVFNEDGLPVDLYDYANSNSKWGLRWNYKYPTKNTKVIEQYNNYVQRLLHQIEYLDDKRKVVKRCNITTDGKEANCATFKLEYDHDYLLKESVYDEHNKLVRQTIYTRDTQKRTQKITVSTPNSEGKMAVTEEHTFEYFVAQ